jgi:hypothetical protein
MSLQESRQSIQEPEYDGRDHADEQSEDGARLAGAQPPA